MSHYENGFKSAQRDYDAQEDPNYWDEQLEFDCEICIWSKFGKCVHPAAELSESGLECSGFQD